VDAYVQLLSVDIGPIKIKGPRHTLNLFDWDGVHASGFLFDIKNITQL
jgi:hypothetical protein